MSIYDCSVKNRNGEDVSISDYKGKVLLIVNTATGCGFTPQYEGLEKLYKEYHDKGLEILDFPCNQFGNQAPGTDVDVNGENESPIYNIIKNEIKDDIIEGIKNKMAMKAVEKISTTCKTKGDIIWNFTKFLVDKEGNVVARYSPTFKPEDMEEKIKELL